jgi:hypothetical protein
VFFYVQHAKRNVASLFSAVPNVTDITVLPVPASQSEMFALLSVCRTLRNCLGIGLKSFDSIYGALFTDDERKIAANFTPFIIGANAIRT